MKSYNPVADCVVIPAGHYLKKEAPMEETGLQQSDYTLDMAPELALRRLVQDCWLCRTSEAIDARVNALIKEVPAERVAQLAIQAREVMGLHHVPFLLVRLMARLETHRHLVGKTLARIIWTPRDLATYLTIYWKGNPCDALSAQSKKGIGRALRKFSPQQLSECGRIDQGALVTAISLTHPRAKSPEQETLFKSLVERNINV